MALAVTYEVEFVGAMPKTPADTIDRSKVKEVHGRV